MRNCVELAAAYAIAKCVKYPSRDIVIPQTLDEQVAWTVAKAVTAAASKRYIL